MKRLLAVMSVFGILLAAQAYAEGDAASAEGDKAGAKKAVKKEKAKADTKAKAGKPKTETRDDGLVIEDTVVGTGLEAKLGSKITVHYRGTFVNGKEFDSSYKMGKPITFALEEGRLIKGWTDGIPGMKVGGKRKLHIPWKSAYGEDGTPGGEIPPKSDLKFEVELVKVE